MSVLPTGLDSAAAGDDRDRAHSPVPAQPPAAHPIPTQQRLMPPAPAPTLPSATPLSPAEAPEPHADWWHALLHGLHHEVDHDKQNREHSHRTPNWYSSALMSREMRRL
jgi:hypothetical protein